MCTGDTTWADIENLMKRFLDGERFGGGENFNISSYGLSKAALMVFTMQMAAKHPNIKVNKNDYVDYLQYEFPSCSPRVCPLATFKQT